MHKHLQSTSIECQTLNVSELSRDSNINFTSYICNLCNFAVSQCQTSQKSLNSYSMIVLYINFKTFLRSPQRKIFPFRVSVPKFQFPATTTIAAFDSKRLRLRFLLSSRAGPERPEEITPVNARLRSRMAKVASRRGCNSPYKK